jgi:hypothetical protein
VSASYSAEEGKVPDYLEFQTMDRVHNPAIFSVVHHSQNHLDSTPLTETVFILSWGPYEIDACPVMLIDALGVYAISRTDMIAGAPGPGADQLGQD